VFIISRKVKMRTYQLDHVFTNRKLSCFDVRKRHIAKQTNIKTD